MASNKPLDALPALLDVPSAQYHADDLGDTPTLSASIAKILVAQSPRHAYEQHPRLNPGYKRPEPKTEWDVGTAAHALLLEGETVAHVVEGYDNWRTKDAQAEAVSARQAGKIPMLRKEWEEVAAMVDAAREELTAHPGFLVDGQAEVTLLWETSGVACRSRLDWLRDDHALILDYKTSRSADPVWFSERGIYDNGYDVKAAFYVRAVKAAFGVDARFRWLVQEKKPPYVLSVVEPGASVLAIGNEKVDRALSLWRGCLETGVWRGYGAGVHVADLPAWEEARWLEKFWIDKEAA